MGPEGTVSAPADDGPLTLGHCLANASDSSVMGFVDSIWTLLTIRTIQLLADGTAQVLLRPARDAPVAMAVRQNEELGPA